MKRLAGDASTHYRSTDHRGEIAWLRLQGTTHKDLQTQFAYMAAADLLQAHDETGISLDKWEGPRNLVELMLQHSILENGV